MSMVRNLQPRAATQIPEPPIARFLFADTRMAWFWLIVRVYVGWQWLVAGIHKLTGFDIEIGSGFGTGSSGSSWIYGTHSLGFQLSGFLHGAITQANASTIPVMNWYGWFLQNVILPTAGFWSYVVVFGEILVGLGLIFGVLTGIAAFFGVFMNMNFLLSGALSINPIIGGLAMFIMLAWRIAGYYGVDRYLLPLIGTPWTGALPTKAKATPPTPVAV